ncbi:hypothetical protein PENSPDRAFT_699464, partial [Peniophora sp. CONT]
QSCLPSNTARTGAVPYIWLTNRIHCYHVSIQRRIGVRTAAYNHARVMRPRAPQTVLKPACRAWARPAAAYKVQSNTLCPMKRMAYPEDDVTVKHGGLKVQLNTVRLWSSKGQIQRIARAFIEDWLKLFARGMPYKPRSRKARRGDERAQEDVHPDVLLWGVITLVGPARGPAALPYARYTAAFVRRIKWYCTEDARLARIRVDWQRKISSTRGTCRSGLLS